MLNNYEYPNPPNLYDCTTCKNGSYNDIFDTYFCSYKLKTPCTNFNKWEEKTNPSFTHLSCSKCGATWLMDNEFPRYCPFCGESRFEDKEKKDCSTCKNLRCNVRGLCIDYNNWEERE